MLAALTEASIHSINFINSLVDFFNYEAGIAVAESYNSIKVKLKIEFINSSIKQAKTLAWLISELINETSI